MVGIAWKFIASASLPHTLNTVPFGKVRTPQSCEALGAQEFTTSACAVNHRPLLKFCPVVSSALSSTIFKVAGTFQGAYVGISQFQVANVNGH